MKIAIEGNGKARLYPNLCEGTSVNIETLCYTYLLTLAWQRFIDYLLFLLSSGLLHNADAALFHPT